MATEEREYYGAGALPEVHLSDLERDPEMERLKRASVSRRLRLSLTDMRQATRDLLDENPSEPRLLFFVLLSDVIFFLNMGLKFVISPAGEQASQGLPEEFAGAVGGLITLAFLVRTATLYVFSGMVAVVCRLFGGQGSFRDTRAGIFWASLVAAPIGVAGALLVVALGWLETFAPIFGEPVFMMPAQLLGVVAFVFFVSASVAESHRFRNTSPVFIAFSILTVVLLVAGLYVWGTVKDAL